MDIHGVVKVNRGNDSNLEQSLPKKKKNLCEYSNFLLRFWLTFI